MQLLKKPERSEDNESENPKERSKKPEKPAGIGDHKRRQNIDHKEDRGRKLVTYYLIWGHVCFISLKYSTAICMKE